jgi:hypothetical protein
MLTRIHRGFRASTHPFWLRSLALVCVLLVGGISTAQAAHIHGQWLPDTAKHATGQVGVVQGQGEEHCSLCVAMHSALPMVEHDAPAPVLCVGQLVGARAQSAPVKLRSFAMFSRPPPAVDATRVGSQSIQ